MIDLSLIIPNSVNFLELYLTYRCLNLLQCFNYYY